MDHVLNFFKYKYLPDGSFDLTFNHISRPLLSFPDEVDETAKKIRSLTDKPILLCLSGGIDGEVVARSFIKNKIEFTALSLRHVEGTNEHDIGHAINFCKKNNIKHKIVPFDVKKFVLEHMQNYINQGYVTWRIFRFMQLHLFKIADEMHCTAVLGGGPAPFFTVNGEICLRFQSDEFMCVEWLRKNDRLHFPYFFWQNPEIMASYYKQDLINFLLADPSYFVNVWPDVSYEKMTVYHKYWPDLVRRRKFDGFESVRGTEWMIQNHVPIRNRVGELKEKYIPMSIVKSQLGI